MLLLGTNMLSSYADAGRVAEALGRMDLVVAYDLFFSDTARRVADVVLPGTAWLEELGCKSTNTHLYLMPQVLEAPGEARPVVWVLRELAQRLGVRNFFPVDRRERADRRDPRPPGHGPRHRRRARRRGRDARPAHLARGPSGREVPDALGEDRARVRGGRRARVALTAGGGRAARTGTLPAHALPGPHLDALPRLLRSRPRATLARQGRPRARALDLAQPTPPPAAWRTAWRSAS
jgi:anaerobic selenocysteine-containing dehydrogenase